MPSAPPLLLLPYVFHVGTLNPADKGLVNGRAADSMEGPGVSVSQHPAEWTHAAGSLDGRPWWRAKLDRLPLLDGHALVRAYSDELGAWAVTTGHALPVAAYAVRWRDNALGELVAMADTQDEAEDEARRRGGTWADLDTLAPTRRVLRVLAHDEGRAGKACPLVWQHLATAWAVTTGLPGVWWTDPYNPRLRSLPRGVLFPHALPLVDFQPATDRRSKP